MIHYVAGDNMLHNFVADAGKRYGSINDDFKSFAFLKNWAYICCFHIAGTIPVSYDLRYIIVKIGVTCQTSF